GRSGQEVDDRRFLKLLEQGSRRGVHPPAGEGQVSPRFIRPRNLGTGAAGSRHSVAHPNLDRHWSDPSRHHARRDGVLFRPVGESQRGVRWRLYLLSRQAANHLVRRDARSGDLLPRPQAERTLPLGVHLMKIESPQSVVHWEAAVAAVTAAVRWAEDGGLRVNVAVVDAGGNLAAFLRMPGGFL